MAVTGTDGALAEKLQSDINARLQSAIGQPIVQGPFLQALCQAIAETVINHFVQNVTLVVDAGIAVQVSPLSGTGATISPGTGTIT